MFGGVSTTAFKDILELDRENWTWKTVKPSGGDIPRLGLYGHTAVANRKNLFIFGE